MKKGKKMSSSMSSSSSSSDSMMELNDDDMGAVAGGMVLDRGSFLRVINTSGMTPVVKILKWGEGTKFKTKDDALAEANRLDSIDYSKK